MPRSKMSISQRAKIFMPFDALRGFKEAIKEKEKVIVKPIELSEDQKNELNYTLDSLLIGDLIKITYYDLNEKNYRLISGILTEINKSEHYIKIVKDKFDSNQIIKIEKLNENIIK